MVYIENNDGIETDTGYSIPDKAAILANLHEDNSKSGGRNIENISSITGSAGTKLSPAYVAAKGSLVKLAKAAAFEYSSNLKIIIT